MVSLAGLSAVPAGFNAGMEQNLAIGDQQRQRMALEALGRTLPLLAQGGGQMPQAPVNTVGQPPPPQGGNPISALLQALQARAAQGQGGDPAGATATPSPQTGAFDKPDITLPTTEVSAAPANNGSSPINSPTDAPPAQRQPLNLPNTAGIPPGSLRWDQVVNAISRANPGIHPDVLAATVDKMQPLLDQASKERWQQMSAQRTASGGGANDIVQAVIEGIIAGTTPPDGKRFYRIWPQVVAGLQERGFDLAKATMDWNATGKMQSSQNSPGQLRLRQVVGFANKSLDIVQQLADKWEGGSYPLLNKVGLYTAAQQGDPLAIALQAQVADLQSELATIYKGGNTPTDRGLERAAQQLDAAWSLPQIKAAIRLAHENLTLRENTFSQPTAGVKDSRYNSATPAPPADPNTANRILDTTGNPEMIQGDQGGPVDGDTATGPNGQKIILRGGQWVPVQ